MTCKKREARPETTEAFAKFRTIRDWEWLFASEEFERQLEFIMQALICSIKHIEDTYKLFSVPLTHERFFEICAAENIYVYQEPRTDLSRSVLGEYKLAEKGDVQYKYIWLKPRQRKANLLMTMAHELAHHFLKHIHARRDGKFSTLVAAGHDHKVKNHFFELEADMIACALLTTIGKVLKEVGNVK